jgi:hypothetical protein
MDVLLCYLFVNIDRLINEIALVLNCSNGILDFEGGELSFRGPESA